MSSRTIRRALLSVSDKTGLLDFARGLASLSVELISTGGTRKALADAGLAVRDVSDVTGFPEMLDGRIKTLHPRIHGGILAVRDNAEHAATLKQHNIEPIDLVVCNLYPFAATVAKPGSTHADIIENIDIGGPTLVRAAAKNYRDVTIVTRPDQYAAVLDEMRRGQETTPQHGETTPQHGAALSDATRERLAAEAFGHVASYDAAISAYFMRRAGGAAFPPYLDLHWERKQTLRYGENPHQKAAFYTNPAHRGACVASAEVLHGKELSFNNILDLDSALNLVREFGEPAAVCIKHNNPCGAAVSATLAAAFQRAYEGDPLSAYGGVLAFNREVDEATAMQITEPGRFIECAIAPCFSDAAFHLLTTRPTWKKNVRLLRTGALDDGAVAARAMTIRDVDGGVLLQERDLNGIETDFKDARVVTKRQPSPREMTDLRFAWLVCKHVKSNAIVLAREGMVVGVGAGQMSRVDSVHLAVRKSGERCKDAVLASDAFFPFRDNVDEAARAGVAAIVQPGGSMRDADSIAACDEHDMVMIFTGVRHFRH
jgi:phosphoribosylaminoimidazolecarboxamide formyltransferase/IMP cyclohydrolase